MGMLKFKIKFIISITDQIRQVEILTINVKVISSLNIEGQ